jgi:hypothetical protein
MHHERKFMANTGMEAAGEPLPYRVRATQVLGTPGHAIRGTILQEQVGSDPREIEAISAADLAWGNAVEAMGRYYETVAAITATAEAVMDERFASKE